MNYELYDKKGLKFGKLDNLVKIHVSKRPK